MRDKHYIVLGLFLIAGSLQAASVGTPFSALPHSVGDTSEISKTLPDEEIGEDTDEDGSMSPNAR